MRLTPLIALATLLSACATEGSVPAADADQGQLVYGDDNRMDLYQVADPFLRAMADGTAALMSEGVLHANADGWQIGTGANSPYPLDLMDTQGVCPTEPFAEQMTPGYCTGFLVSDDLMVTAGHCISSSNCAGTRFVFGFEMEDANTVRSQVDDDDVYSCAAVEGRQLSGDEDWAVVRLDRPVQGRTPMAIRRAGTVPVGTDLVLVGHPSGLPVKIAAGGEVKSANNGVYFDANVDSYGGNSGSPVLNAVTGEVEGILVRGNNDYTWNGSCYVSNQCSDANGCPGYEDVTRTTLFDHLIPELGAAEDCEDGNDSPATAEPLAAGSYAGLEVCSADEDWYAITLEAGETLTARIDFLHADGDLDMALFDGATELLVSESTDDMEVVTLTATATTTYTLRVYGYQGADNLYDLDIAVQSGTTMDLSALDAPTGGQPVTWQVQDGPASTTVHLVLGNPGTTSVPGCGSMTVGIRNPVVLGTVQTDANGAGNLTMDVPAVATGASRTLYAVSLDTCSASDALAVTFR